MKESTHQKKVITHLRKNYPDTRFFVNPFAGVTLYNMGKIQAAQFKMKMHELGAEKSQPDISIQAARCGYTGLSIELKTHDKYPFRFWRGKPGTFWIDKAKDNEEKEHVIAQASYLHDLKNENRLAVFCGGSDQAITLIDQYMNEEKEQILARLDQWEFFLGKYVPVKRVVDYLKV